MFEFNAWVTGNGVKEEDGCDYAIPRSSPKWSKNEIFFEITAL